MIRSWRRAGLHSSLAVHAEVEVNPGDALERAIDSTLPKPQRAPRVPDDPMGLEAAFDLVHGPMQPDEPNDAASPSESECVASSASTSSGSPREGGEALTDDGADVGDGGVSQTSELFERRGNKLFWNQRHVGSLTAWGRSVACSCKVHPGCRTPASTCWGTDAILIDWLLLSINMDGSQKITKDAHVHVAVAMQARVCMPAPSSSSTSSRTAPSPRTKLYCAVLSCIASCL